MRGILRQYHKLISAVPCIRNLRNTISTHTHQLCSLQGPLAGKQAHKISMRQPKPGSSYKQGLHKGHNGDAPILKCLWFFTASYNIRITAIHLTGYCNSTADMLSRNQSKKFPV